MLKKKLEVTSNHFRPFPFVVKKDRKGGLVIESAAIKWDALEEDQIDTQWAHCLNVMWSNDKEGVISVEKLTPYIERFMKNQFSSEEIEAYSHAPAWMTSNTMLSVAFLLEKVYNKPSAANWLKSKLSVAVQHGRTLQKEKTVVIEETTEKPKPRKTIQEYMAEQLSDLLGELEGLSDEKLTTKHDILGWLRNRNVAKVHLDSIEAKFRPQLQELYEAVEGEDEQLVEAYSSYKKSEMKKMIEWYENLLSDIDAYRRLKVTTRKIRVRKSKTPAQLVRHLKHLGYSEDYKIQSVNPEKIIGATVLWLFNVKYRKLMVFNASEYDKELTVKGSTILGWDPKTSHGKTLRKPEEQLPKFMDGGKVAARNFLKEIKGKESPLNGRLNRDTLILKCF